MKGINNTLRLFTEEELQLLHEATLQILEDPGMRIAEMGFLEALDGKGAVVDYQKREARFPRALIQKNIKMMQNGSKSFSCNPEQISARNLGKLKNSLSGPATRFLDYEKGEIRIGNERDALSIIQFGNALKDIEEIVCPLVYSVDLNGKNFHPKLWPIKTAALVAKNTYKLGGSEIWSLLDLKYLIKIGCLLKEGWENYKRQPIFLMCKITQAPLVFPNPSAKIIFAMAKVGLPCAIGSMPISGVTSPVTLAGNIAMANAEILGVMSAVKAVNPYACFWYVGLSGSLDMRRGSAFFSTPEVLLQDMGLCELHTRLYKLPYKISGMYVSGKYPGVQAAIEKTMATFRNGAGGWLGSIAPGLIAEGKLFSLEQVLIDIEIAKAIQRFFRGIEINEETLATEIIRKVGIGRHFLSEEHTLRHFKDRMWLPELFDRTISCENLREDQEKDILKVAHNKVKEIQKNYQPFHLNKEISQQIDQIVKEAKGEFHKNQGEIKISDIEELIAKM